MNLIEVLENLPLKRFHYILLTISSFIYALTAMNVMLISVALSSIAKEWSLDPITVGMLASAGYVGMAIGAFSSGLISDRVGRRNTLIIMISCGSVFTALSALTWDVISISIIRFIAGIGLGGTLPLPGVYMSEYPPARYRGRFVGIVETSWVYGAILAVMFGFIIIPGHGWRPAFSSALIPLILLPFIIIYMPESVRFLQKVGRVREAYERLKKYKLLDISVRFEPEKVEQRIIEERYSVKDLFSRRYIRRTLVLWILWAVLVYTYHGIFIWLPSIYAGPKFEFSIVRSLWWALIITLVQIPGYYSATFLLDRVGRKFVLILYLGVAGIGSALLAAAGDVSSILLYSAVISFFNLGAWAGLYTYTPELYPTKIRGTGTGTAASIGRIAGIAAPTVTGYLFAVAGGELVYAFIIFAAAHLIAAGAVVLIGEETRGRRLEEISEQVVTTSSSQ